MLTKDDYIKKLKTMIEAKQNNVIQVNKAQYTTSFYADNTLIARVQNDTLNECHKKNTIPLTIKNLLK